MTRMMMTVPGTHFLIAHTIIWMSLQKSNTHWEWNWWGGSKTASKWTFGKSQPFDYKTLQVWLLQVWCRLATIQTWPFHHRSICQQVCQWETVPPLQIFWHNQDIDQFMALFFHEIGINRNRPDDRYKQMTSWSATRKSIKRTYDSRQLCVGQWYIAAKSKLSFVIISFLSVLIKTFSQFLIVRLDKKLWQNVCTHIQETNTS